MCHSGFASGVYEARINLYMDGSEQKRIMEVRYMGIYGILYYSESTVWTCKAMRNVHLCQPKWKPDEPFCKITRGFLKPSMNTSPRIILCLCAINVRGAGVKPGRCGKYRSWPTAANVKNVTRWAEKLRWWNKDQWEYDIWMEISQNQGESHETWIS